MSSLNQFLKTVLMSTILCLFISLDYLHAELSHFPEPKHTSANMSILIIEISGINVVNGSELAIFTPDSVIAGAIELGGDPPWGLAAWANEESTPESDGFNSGDSMRFVFWDPVRMDELDADVSEILQGTQLRYVIDGFLVLKLHINAPVLPPTPPEWKDVPNEIDGEEGSMIEFEIRGEDTFPDELRISFSSDDLPFAATFIDFGNGRGRFRWLPTYVDAGVYAAEFTLSNSLFDVVTRVEITVNQVAATEDLFILDGPYPNPVIGTAFLKYTIPDNVDFTLKAVDLTGRRVAILDEGSGQGEFQSMIYGNDLSSGSYIFMLDVGYLRKYRQGIVLR